MKDSWNCLLKHLLCPYFVRSSDSSVDLPLSLCVCVSLSRSLPVSRSLCTLPVKCYLVQRGLLAWFCCTAGQSEHGSVWNLMNDVPWVVQSLFLSASLMCWFDSSGCPLSLYSLVFGQTDAHGRSMLKGAFSLYFIVHVSQSLHFSCSCSTFVLCRMQQYECVWGQGL